VPGSTDEIQRMAAGRPGCADSNEGETESLPMSDRAPWQSPAACRGLDTSLFFPFRGEAAPEALATCRRCPVSEDCRDYAVDTGQRFGIWGGTSERQRRRIRTQRLQQRGSVLV